MPIEWKFHQPPIDKGETMEEGSAADEKACSAGIAFAMQAALRALLKAHPKIDELLPVLKHEGEESLAHLLNMGVPDRAIEAFRDVWNGLVPYVDEGPAGTDPRL
jgi:hypothetical protein